MLEGGYDLAALRASVASTVEGLLAGLADGGASGAIGSSRPARRDRPAPRLYSMPTANPGEMSVRRSAGSTVTGRGRARAATTPAGSARARRTTVAGAIAPESEREGLVVILSGLSGAGKSQASKLFEDLGFACIDNLPTDLLDGIPRPALREPGPLPGRGPGPGHPRRRSRAGHRARSLRSR